MTTEVILTLSDDAISLDGARSLTSYFKEQKIETVHLRCVTNCFLNSNLNENDINLTILGHTHFSHKMKQPLYKVGNANFMPSKLVNKIDEELTVANIKSTQLKQVRCLGCTIGLLIHDDELNVQKTASHQIAEHFVEKGYTDLVVTSLINYKQFLEGSGLKIDDDGSITLYGQNTLEDETAFDILCQDYNNVESQITILKTEFDQLDINDDENKDRLISKIDRLELELIYIENEQEKRTSTVWQFLDIINHIDNNPSFQLKFPVELQEIVGILEKINSIRLYNIVKLSNPNMPARENELTILHKKLNDFLAKDNNQQLFENFYDHDKKAAVQLIYEIINENSFVMSNFISPPKDRETNISNQQVLIDLANKINACNKNEWQVHLKDFLASNTFKNMPQSAKDNIENILNRDNALYLHENHKMQ